MRTVLLVGAALALSGCTATTNPELAAADDHACRSYGHQPGTSAFAMCRQALDQQRIADTRAKFRTLALAGAIMSQPDPEPAPMLPRSTICTSTTNMWGHTTTICD